MGTCDLVQRLAKITGGKTYKNRGEKGFERLYINMDDREAEALVAKLEMLVGTRSINYKIIDSDAPVRYPESMELNELQDGAFELIESSESMLKSVFKKGG